MARILVVDDDEGVRSFVAEALEAEEHDVDQADSAESALRRLERRAYHLILTDLRMPGQGGLALLRRARADWPETEVIVLTAYGSVQGAVEAMKLGAFDYLQKPLDGPDELRLLARRALERASLRALEERARGEESDEPPLSHGAPVMVPVVQAVRKVAPTAATVLLLGESGTGKEVAARAIHRQSPRAAGPFVAVNCAALSESLLESELFGHEKGAFTGATAQRRGRIELSDGGTFLLDEVGELKGELQAKLLRALQERSFERVGGTRTISVDVRFIAATNRDLQALVQEGRFRADLYHRLAVFPIRLPPLRERREDVPALAASLLRRIGRQLGRPGLALDGEAEAELRAREWPGNVRELHNVLERAAILSEQGTIGKELLAGPEAPPRTAPRTLEEMEREAILEALRQSGGHRRQAADRLGIGLRTLYDKLKVYGI